MSEAAIQEAVMSAQFSTGISAYMYGMSYPTDKWKRELNTAVSYIKSRAPVTAKK